ncbi:MULTISPECIES: ATP-binding cassette domain-containing protein [Piscirickettsiaceae]|jgi:phospholipid/cholesterol/gamma-HCH transport system ATP-binding protein|uniref:ATP-binding cassette domain-containing protein n=1 Tax=Hydrogenovibrio thermophilus TaxID=265883 RepID=A0A410H2P5_9GAMM|nr:MULTISPECIES: ATP-binding cassette domain-containing protein [Piscirickettsiaceae]AZR82292.1 ABC transporter ATP-binding protein [Thiomicrospira sp. S5]QAB15166.1 ATP-binding cassette domain-containing protein [Hydrogenovibrio thermophilus]
MASETLIEIQNVTFSRGSRKIFENFSLNIPVGKVTAIMGPSGTGKTTLLKLIAGQLKPEKGTILVNGQNVHKLRRSKLYELRRTMGMLFQSGALLTDLNVFDNVAFPIREHTKLPEEIIRPLVLMKLQAVGLRGAQDLMAAELSGGMSRRVALARAIALDPDMIFYDEPFVGQDPITMGVLIELIRKLNDSLGVTSVAVSHDVNEVLSIADFACVISEGRVVAEGTPEALLASESEYVQQFLQGLPDGPVPFDYPAKPFLQDLI